MKRDLKARAQGWAVCMVLAGIAACSGRDPLLGADGIVALAPTVMALSPANGATAVSVNTATIVAVFSVPVSPIPGAASFALTCSAPCTTPAGTFQLDPAGLNASFSLASGSSLAPLTQYSATVNGYRGTASGLALVAPYVWTFRTGATPDTTRPSVLLTRPVTSVPGPVGIATNSSVAAQFSEEMTAASVAASMSLGCVAPCVAPTGTVSYVAGSRYGVFTPSAALAPATLYTATISAAATDLAGNALAGNQAVGTAAGAHVWRFTTGAGADSTAPTVSSVSPPINASGVATNALITASFSEAMNAASISSASFVLSCPGGTPVSATVGYAASGNIATLSPSAPLPSATVCTATVTTAVRDAANNALASAFSWSFTTGAASDATAPTIIDRAPAANAASVAINTLVAATFSEPMDPLTLTAATFTLACPAGVPVLGTVGYAVGANVATFSPALALPPGSLCTATVTTGARDTAGNGLASAVGWTFTTGVAADTIAPTASATRPSPGATGAPVNTLVIAGFSELMNPLSLNTASVTVACPAGAPVTGIVSYTASGSAVTFMPVSALPGNTSCVATISTGALDVAGNPLASAFSWTFTTGATPDTTAPTVLTTTPLEAATGVAINSVITANFSEAMDPLTLTPTSFRVACPTATPVVGTVSYAVGGSIATFTPSAGLPASTACTATLSTGARDAAGNALASPFNWSFTTGVAPDTTPPTVLSSNPANAAVGVCINKTISATFSEPMNALSITTATFTVTSSLGASVTGLVAYDAPTRIATFNPVADLTGTPATLYTVRIAGGPTGATDLAGNGLGTDSVSVFTTNGSTCATAPVLGAAAPFAGIGGLATLTNDGRNTVINGDIGVGSTATAITGLRDSGANVYTVTPSNDGRVNGLVYTNDAPPGSIPGDAISKALLAAQSAFDSISPAVLLGGINVANVGQCPTCGGVGNGADELAGRVLPPGIYLSATGTYDIGGPSRTVANLVLDAGGDADAVWIFQTAVNTGTLNVGLTGPATPAVPIQVQLVNGALARNVFWYVPGGAVVGTGSTLVGTLLAQAAITFSTTGTAPLPVITTLNGRAIAINAGTTMANTVINVPAP